ncbi:MAG: bifunctional glutamate N-acetyltransferase/amino-acid acetyltransferase ArgJ [Thermodesulfobacteriota bacterium]|nr:bifunctional glutamate N-acetyltransferase/amino-acid acetyltransferase ArgJ [Thermodesulfobacteriota bacterium]
MNLPKSFLFASIAARIKSEDKKRLDMGLVYCPDKALVSGVFTQNRIKAAPVLIGMDIAEKGYVHAILANSGNANACTGDQGRKDAMELMNSVADELGIDPLTVIPLSTGVIGEPLPVERMLSQVHDLSKNLGPDPDGFARAIMTTDTCPKVVSKNAGRATFLGIAKGSGMVSPDMATTLGIVLTDAIIDKKEMDRILTGSVETTFNAISIDGDTSTNDTLLLVSSCKVEADPKSIEHTVQQVIKDLALMVVGDGEGATKLIHITVTGCRDKKDAKTIAMNVANSALVKTAFFGEDPNWGRIIAAIGYSGVDIDPMLVGIRIAGTDIVCNGIVCPDYNEDHVHDKIKAREIALEISVGQGPGGFEAWTTDLSYEYVRINAEYRS